MHRFAASATGSFRTPGQERFNRAKTLGEAYTEKAIAERIKGKVILKALKTTGVGDKLSDLAKLCEEYSRLSEEKDRLYAEYGSLKKRMREYDAVKQNIDSILSPTVGRNRTKPCSFSDIHTLLSSNLMCGRRFAVDKRTLFPYKIMCDCQSEVRSMNAKEKIEELLKASEDGTITAAQVTEAGLHRSVLQEFVKSGEMYRFGRGLYVRSSAWEDDFYLLQRKYGRGIYSHDTALYLLGYSDRTPAKYTMTFPKGYNAPSLKQENLIIKRVVPENYEFGRIEIESPSGNPIRVYDLERTLCDILRGSGSDVQIIGEAMKRYAASKDKNIHKLMQYADQLRVKPKVLRYMEVLL